MSTRPPEWETILSRLKCERLKVLASDPAIGLEEFELTAYLVVEGAGRKAEDTPWWPEAVAMRASGSSLREIARRFQTEPRRLRRALARLGLRVAGQDLAAGHGSARIEGVRDRLGAEPDAVVAKAAGVAVEAIKGERRRLDRAPYFQRPRVRLTADDEAWIRGPKKLPRDRSRVEPDVLQVVRRQSRPDLARVASAAPVTPSAPRPPVVLRATESPVRPSFFRDDRWAEIERLTEPTVKRDGNRRLVRSGESGRSTTSQGDAPVDAAPPAPLPSLPSTGTRRLVTPQRPVGSPVAPNRNPSASVSASASAVAVVLAESRPAPAAGPAEVAWRVEVPGWANTLTVYASDIAGAALAAVGKVPASLLARASIWRADHAAPGADFL